MSKNPMQEGNEALIQLFRAVEEGLAIAGSNAESDLGLTLETAEIELNLATKKTVSGGIDVEAIGVKASAKTESESKHAYKLKLRRGPKKFKLGPPSGNELAETILALAKATQAISSRTREFVVDEAVVTVDLSQTKEGGVKVWFGGDASSGDVYKVTLTFRRSDPE